MASEPTLELIGALTWAIDEATVKSIAASMDRRSGSGEPWSSYVEELTELQNSLLAPASPTGPPLNKLEYFREKRPREYVAGFSQPSASALPAETPTPADTDFALSIELMETARWVADYEVTRGGPHLSRVMRAIDFLQGRRGMSETPNVEHLIRNDALCYAIASFVRQESGARLSSLEAENARLREELKDYALLKQAVNESSNDCDPGCDSYGHTDTCPAQSTAKWLTDQQREIARLREDAARLEYLETLVYRYTREVLDEMECGPDSQPEGQLFFTWPLPATLREGIDAARPSLQETTDG